MRKLKPGEQAHLYEITNTSTWIGIRMWNQFQTTCWTRKAFRTWSYATIVDQMMWSLIRPTRSWWHFAMLSSLRSECLNWVDQCMCVCGMWAGMGINRINAWHIGVIECNTGRCWWAMCKQLQDAWSLMHNVHNLHEFMLPAHKNNVRSCAPDHRIETNKRWAIAACDMVWHAITSQMSNMHLFTRTG